MLQQMIYNSVLYLSLILSIVVCFCSCNPFTVISPLKFNVAETNPDAEYFKYQQRCLANEHDISCKLLDIRGGSAPFSFAQINQMLSLSSLKMILQLVLTTFNVLCWSIPLRSGKFAQNASLLSLGNAFAGGIFLMLSFGHLMPQAIDTLEKVGVGKPMALSFTLVGFLAMLFIEKVAFDVDPEEDSAKKVGENKESVAPAQGFKVNSAMVLCMAMSLHSFFEAAALGLAMDHTSAYMMAACVALHQPAESLALLIAFLKTDMSASSITKWLIGFSCMGLLGVSAGIYVNTIASESVEAIILAITAGTFVYVGATEIANEEFEGASNYQKLLRFVAYCGGAFVMASISTLSEQWEQH